MDNQNVILVLVFIVAAVSLIKAMFGKKEKPVEVVAEEPAPVVEEVAPVKVKAARKPKTPVAKKAAVKKIKKEIASIPAEKPAKKTRAKKAKAEVNG